MSGLIHTLVRFAPLGWAADDRSNIGVTAVDAEFSGWEWSQLPLSIQSMFTLSENMVARIVRPKMAIVLGLAIMLVVFAGGTARAEVRSADIEAVFGTAFEVRPPSAIVIASNSGLVTLNFDSDSDLNIGSNKAVVDEIAEGDRVISTAFRNAEDELMALRTLVRMANTQPITKHVVGVVSNSLADELSIQTKNGEVVAVLIPAGIEVPSVGDGITMVARLDRSSGILTAVGFELTSRTVERIQDALDKTADQAEAERLAQIAIDARSQHLSALDDAARAIKRVVDSATADADEIDQARAQLEEIQRRFKELQGIYQTAATDRGEAQPQLRISGALVDEAGVSTFTVVPHGDQDANPFSVDFVYNRDETTVDLPPNVLKRISETAENPQLLADVLLLIDPGSELDVKYSIDSEVRTAESIEVHPPRLVEELEAVLEHESRRAFNGVTTLVEIDTTLEDAIGIVIAANEKQGAEVTAKVTDETEITLDGRLSTIESIRPGQAVDIQFESFEAGSLSDITGTDVTLRALAIRSRSSAPTEEDHISGIVESIDSDEFAITIRPTDGSLIPLRIGDGAPVVRNGQQATFENVKPGDLVVDATRQDSDSDVLTQLVVVARSNVKFSGTITGIGREPTRLQVTGDNGQSLNVLVVDDTWVILDGRRVKFSAVTAGMNVVSGVYTVTGRDGAFYNVATIVSIESPKVRRASGIITNVNVIEGTLTVLAGNSDETKTLNLKMPESPLGENLSKNGQPIRSLLEVERGDKADIVLYEILTGIVKKLSVVSDNFIRSRGTLQWVSDNNRTIQVELATGNIFLLWVGAETTIHLDGRRISTMQLVKDQFLNSSILIPEVLFIRDSIDSDEGVIISINFQTKSQRDQVESEVDRQEAAIGSTISGVIEAISGDQWVIGGRVITVNASTRFTGADPEIGEVAVAVLVSRLDGTFIARSVTVSRRRD